PLLRFQSGTYWARIAAADSNAQALKNAIDRFEQAIKLSPDLWIHHLNLSVLYARAGQQADALREAKIATASAALDPVAWLNLGMALEASGETAQDAYIKALQLEPRWSEAGFWQSSPIRQDAQKQYLALPGSAN